MSTPVEVEKKWFYLVYVVQLNNQCLGSGSVNFKEITWIWIRIRIHFFQCGSRIRIRININWILSPAIITIFLIKSQN